MEIELHRNDSTSPWHLILVNEEEEETDDCIVPDAIAEFLIKKMGLEEIAKNHFAIKPY